MWRPKKSEWNRLKKSLKEAYDDQWAIEISKIVNKKPVTIRSYFNGHCTGNPAVFIRIKEHLESLNILQS